MITCTIAIRLWGYVTVWVWGTLKAVLMSRGRFLCSVLSGNFVQQDCPLHRGLPWYLSRIFCSKVFRYTAVCRDITVSHVFLLRRPLQVLVLRWRAVDGHQPWWRHADGTRHRRRRWQRRGCVTLDAVTRWHDAVTRRRRRAVRQLCDVLEDADQTSELRPPVEQLVPVVLVIVRCE